MFFLVSGVHRSELNSICILKKNYNNNQLFFKIENERRIRANDTAYNSQFNYSVSDVHLFLFKVGKNKKQ